MEGWLGLRDCSESSLSFILCLPGTSSSTFQPTQRWPKLWRTYGTGSIVGDLTKDLRPGLT
jgi:hypothetical protein